MSAWMFIPYAQNKVETGEWTQKEANAFLSDILRIDLEQDEFDRKMCELWKKSQESKN